LAPWAGPYGGVPPFAGVTAAHLGVALRAAIADTLANVARIADDPQAPTFDNTIAAYERAGALLDRVGAVYAVYVSTMSDEAVQALEREVAPELAALSDAITQNRGLFTRIAAVHEASEASEADGRDALTPEQRRVVWYHHTTFVRAAAPA
jgi:peptidyl-dipeptidase Dcp